MKKLRNSRIINKLVISLTDITLLMRNFGANFVRILNICLNSDNHLALYESQGIFTFENFIDALLSQGVKEALYTDMGQSWNNCFYRVNHSDKTPDDLHSTSLPYASNFIVIKTK